MDARVEIYLYSGSTSGNTTVNGVLELFDSEPINLVYTVEDLKEIGKTKSEFSQTFTIPGTKSNTVNIFKDYFQITNDSEFDPRKKVQCDILVDSIPILRNAVMQLMSVSINENKVPTYEVQVFGATSDFITEIGETKIGDLDFSDLNHIWNFENVVNSWTSTTVGYYYPWVDYGYNYGNEDLRGVNYLNPQTQNYGVSYNQMFPAIYAKTIVDHIFSGFGYTYDSSFFNSNNFKNIAHIFNSSKDFKLDQDYIEQRKASATNQSVQATVPLVNNFSTINLDTGFFIMPFPNNEIDPSNLYNNSTYIYTSNAVQSLKCVVNIAAAFTYFSSTSNKMNQFTVNPTLTAYLHRSSYFGGAPAIQAISKNYPTYDASVSSAVITSYTFDFADLDDPLSPTNYPAQSGETFWVTVRATGQGINFFGAITSATTHNWIHIIADNSNITYSPTNKLVGGQLLNYNLLLPGRNEKIVDYLKSLQTMFNLVIIPDKENPKKLRIEPRDDIYATGQTKDWTLKVDHTKPIVETPLAEFQAKSFVFTHKPDSDYLNDNYQKTISGRIYGDAIISTETEFLKSENKKQTIFSPTPFTLADDVEAVNENIAFFPTAKIFKINNNNQFEKTDCGFRIGYVRTLPLTAGKNTVKFRVNNNQFNIFPYFGQFDNPGFTSGGTGGITTAVRNMQNINFDETEFMYSIPLQYSCSISQYTATTESLVDKYWQKTINEITDKNARIVKCWIHLTPQDINGLNYSDRIYLFGLTPESGEYYRINKINYVAGSNDSHEVELVKIKDLTAPISRKMWLNYSTTGIVNSGGNNTNMGSALIYGGGLGNSLYGPANETSSSYNFIIGGSNISNGPNNIINGNNNDVNARSSNNIVIGSGNTLDEATTNSTINGNLNIVGETSKSIFIQGSNNILEDSNYSAQTTNITIFGDNNYVLTNISGTTIFGNNITADTSNTIYFNNLITNGIGDFCLGGVKTNDISGCTGDITVRDNLIMDTGLGIKSTNGGSCIYLDPYNLASNIFISNSLLFDQEQIEFGAGYLRISSTTGGTTVDGLTQVSIGTLNNGSYYWGHSLGGTISDYFEITRYDFSGGITNYLYAKDNTFSGYVVPTDIAAYPISIGAFQPTINAGINSSVVLGGQNITVDRSDTVFTPSLNVEEFLSTKLTTYAATTTQENDITITSSFIYIDTTAVGSQIELTGIDASNIKSGTRVVIAGDTNGVKITAENANSSPNNQFYTDNAGTNVTILEKETAEFIYDDINGKWRYIR